MSCPIKVNINKIELTMHTSCYCILDLLCDYSFFVNIPSLTGFLLLTGLKKRSLAKIFTFANRSQETFFH